MDALFGEPFADFPEHQVQDLEQFFPAKGLENDHLVDAVEEFGPEGLLHRFDDTGTDPVPVRHLALARGGEAEALPLHGIPCPDIAGHDDHAVAKIDGMPLAVGEAPVFKYLEKDIENIGMGLFDLVKEHHRVGPPPKGLRKLAALLVAHVARGRAYQFSDLVALHILTHVEPHHGILAPEKELRERTGQLRLPDSRRSKEEKAPDRPIGILQTAPGSPDGPRDGVDGFGLVHHAMVDLLLHAHQSCGFLLG